MEEQRRGTNALKVASWRLRAHVTRRLPILFRLWPRTLDPGRQRDIQSAQHNRMVVIIHSGRIWVDNGAALVNTAILLYTERGSEGGVRRGLVQWATCFDSSAVISPDSNVSSLTGSGSSTVLVNSGSANGDSLIGLVATFVGETDRVWLTGGEVAWGMLQCKAQLGSAMEDDEAHTSLDLGSRCQRCSAEPCQPSIEHNLQNQSTCAPRYEQDEVSDGAMGA